MPHPYSPLRYPGGKARLADFLIELLRANHLGGHTHYIEPFAGGAGAALRLLCEEYVAEITINDADPRVRCFWEAAVHQTDELVSLIEAVDLTVDTWHAQREIYRAADDADPVTLGFATFFLNRTTRSGIVHNGGPIGGYDQTGNYKIDARFNRRDLVRRIQRIGFYADRIQVSGVDGLSLLSQLAEAAPQNTFAYLDPPYYDKGGELYLNQMTHAEHASLARHLAADQPYTWVMTYDDVPEIRMLYEGFQVQQFFLSYSAYERRSGSEVLISRADLVLPPGAEQLLHLAA